VASERARIALVVTALVGSVACSHAPSGARFPLRDPMWLDDDVRPFDAPCVDDDEKPGHKICTPAKYESPFAADGLDNMVFRPISRFFAVDPAGESVNVNAFDEVPSSSWFTNRIGLPSISISPEQLAKGNCGEPVDVDAPDGSWLIDQGKENGANPGFRVRVPGRGKFLLKADLAEQPERATAATAIGTRIYHAVGFNTGCDRVVYIRRSLLKLKEGLSYSDNTGVTRPFGEKQLDKVLGGAAKRGERYRLAASPWLPGRPLGPFEYTGTRSDDPNDVIPHEDRRELRGQRVLAAWLNHFDSREQNSMNTWVSMNAEDPDASPGYIKHWIIDLNDLFGSEWDWESLSKRIGFSYYFDGGDIFEDFLSLGIPKRPWDRVKRSAQGDIFGYFESDVFEPDDWKPGYQNPAFLRMTEHDAAWMARIIARITPEHIAAVVRVGDFTQERHTEYLTRTLVTRRYKVLARYFAKLSPITDLEFRGTNLCGLDLARATRTYHASQFHYTARSYAGEKLDDVATPLITTSDGGLVCVELAGLHHASSPYRVVKIANGVSDKPIRVDFYDLGSGRFRIVGIQR
jgi:hypothetical protein